MKSQTNFILYFFLIISIFFGCKPTEMGYYKNAEGLDGYALKSALKEIIDNHTVLSYGSLDYHFNKIDVDLYFENDGSLLDVYSERTKKLDPYKYNFSEKDQCGSYDQEGDCWNKEHVFPQGFFNQQLPMRSDMHQVLPTDGYVNNRRNNFPFGNVGKIKWESENGSKLGKCISTSQTELCFEPIDEFKGDIARILFYFATRYEIEVTSKSWDNPHANPNNPLNGSNDQVYEDWFVKVLLEWHKKDPVSQKELDRNEKIFQIQGNRNPFVDHPEWVNKIWK